MKTHIKTYAVPLALAFLAIYVANKVPQVGKLVGKAA